MKIFNLKINKIFVNKKINQLSFIQQINNKINQITKL